MVQNAAMRFDTAPTPLPKWEKPMQRTWREMCGKGPDGKPYPTPRPDPESQVQFPDVARQEDHGKAEE